MASKFFKRLGRKTAKVHKQINRVVTPLAAAGATFIGGPVAGAAVTAIGAQSGYYFRATEARDKGIKGRAARSLGRGERRRVGIYGAAGIGVGAAGAFTTALATGSTFGQALGSTAFGHGGKALLFGSEGTVFATPTEKALASGVGPFGSLNPAVSGTQLPTSGVPGLVTQSQLAASLSGGSTAAEAAAAGGSSSTAAKLLGIAPALLNAYSTAKPAASNGANGNINPNSYGPLGPDLASMFGGGGSGGESGGGGGGGFMNAPAGMGEESKNSGMIAAIVIGALLLAA